MCDSDIIVAYVGVLTWRGGWFHCWCNPGEYYTWGFCNLVINLRMRIWPIRGLSARQ